MNDQAVPELSPEEGGPITDSPDLPRSNGFIKMLGRCWTERSLKPWKHYILVPASAPGDFAAKPVQTLAASLWTSSDAVAQALLAEAEATWQEPLDRIDGAERRATTLLGAVAIAASIVVAGASLLLDPSKVRDQGWRIVFAVFLLAFVFCLVACALRALGATSRIFRFFNPGPDRIIQRARMPASQAMSHRAAELLRVSEVANEVGRVKVGLLRSATWWFRSAIFMLAILATAIVAYTIAVSEPSTGATGTTTILVLPHSLSPSPP